MVDTATPINLAVTEDDFPALYLAADRTSRMAQRRHLWFTGTILSALVACAALGTLSAVFPKHSTVLALFSTGWAATSFMLTSMRKALKPEKAWYGGRAVAESAKSLAWRYMTGADPYPTSLTPVEADGKFIADLRLLARDQTPSALGFGAEFSDRPQVSARMREVRALPLEQRRQLYLKERIDDQRRWYGRKARSSQVVANRYFVLIQVSQALALGGTVLLFSAAVSKWNLGGVFSSLASALIAWLQLRQHEELAQTYSVAALDLGFIEEQAMTVSNEKELSDLVVNAENTVSREHSMWITRHNS